MLNSRDFKKKYPAVGEDIKVMGLRDDNSITLTVASAMVSKYIDGRDTYINLKEELKEHNNQTSSKKKPKETLKYLLTPQITTLARLKKDITSQ